MLAATAFVTIDLLRSWYGAVGDPRAKDERWLATLAAGVQSVPYADEFTIADLPPRLTQDEWDRLEPRREPPAPSVPVTRIDDPAHYRVLWRVTQACGHTSDIVVEEQAFCRAADLREHLWEIHRQIEEAGRQQCAFCTTGQKERKGG